MKGPSPSRSSIPLWHACRSRPPAPPALAFPGDAGERHPKTARPRPAQGAQVTEHASGGMTRIDLRTDRGMSGGRCANPWSRVCMHAQVDGGRGPPQSASHLLFQPPQQIREQDHRVGRKTGVSPHRRAGVLNLLRVHDD